MSFPRQTWICREQTSAEWYGVNCFYCNINLPPNRFQYDQIQGYACFYEKANVGSSISYSLGDGTASISYTINNGTKLFQYFKKSSQSKYMCPLCFTKEQSKQNCLDLETQLQGTGVVTIPTSLWAQRKSKNQTTLTSKEFGLRLSGHPDGKVTLTKNNDFWELWQWEWISPNNFFWRSKAHGTYLRAWPDGHLDLTTNKSAWETWTKKDYGTYHTWKSCHGGFLSSDPNGTVYLTPNQLANEFWLN